MVWCVNCAQDKPTKDVDGKICCSFCGKVLEEDNFSIEPTFVKNASGQSQLSGNKVNTIQSNYSASRERTLKEAYEGIDGMLYGLGIDGGDSIAHPALAFYTIAVERNFTRGRRKEQVQAACLYIACREKKKPFLLIDFSEYLRIKCVLCSYSFARFYTSKSTQLFKNLWIRACSFIYSLIVPGNPKKARTVFNSTDDNGVKIDPQVDETYEEAFGEDVHYNEDVEGYDYSAL